MMLLSDRIVEKNTESAIVCPPIRKPKNAAVVKTGFPEPPKVTVVSSSNSSNPTAEESFHIRPSDLAKLEWTNPVSLEDDETSSSSIRYDFDGKILDVQNCMENQYKPELYHHGNDPGRPGYTLEELFHLSQSGFASQKTIAIRTVGRIANEQKRDSRRQYHRSLIGEWKAHIRFSVACSDTSSNVRTVSWEALLSLIENLDTDCGCLIEDLSSVPEFFRAFDPEDTNSIKVMAYIANQLESCAGDDQEEFVEIFIRLVRDSCEAKDVDFESFKIGLNQGFLKDRLGDDSASPAEVFATICDRIACISSEPLADEDVNFFSEILHNLRPSLPFYIEGKVDEFAWTSRCNLVLQALMEGASSPLVAKIAWQFTSSLFPMECRASIWCDMDILDALGRSLGPEGIPSVFGNHAKLDFTCAQTVPGRDNATILRAIRQGCVKYIESADCVGNKTILETARNLVDVLVSV